MSSTCEQVERRERQDCENAEQDSGLKLNDLSFADHFDASE